MRNTNLDDVLFPVEMQPIYRLNRDGQVVKIPSHRTVVNCLTQQPVGVVSAGYRVVTNREALGFARDCARQLFGAAKGEELVVFNVYAPERAWCCVLDLIHKGHVVNIGRREVYLPFLRVTNSYNATRALRFDVGFCRQICANGMIFEKQAIEFRFTHTHRQIGQTLQFDIAKNRLEVLRRQFERDAERLFNYTVPPGREVPLFFRALGLPLPPKPDDNPNGEAAEQFSALKTAVRDLILKYYGQIGPNGYALFNAVTDFASHPPELPKFRRSTPAMQAIAGRWAREFAEGLSSTPPLDLEEHLGDYGSLTA
jgi:hypothetical protein